ncbi:hypothetical protein D3C80_1091980 [compost metagenome]
MAIEIFQNRGCKMAGSIRATMSIEKFDENAEIKFEKTNMLMTKHKRSFRFILVVNEVIKGEETATVMAKALSNHPAVSIDTWNCRLIVGRMPTIPNSVVIMPKAPKART